MKPPLTFNLVRYLPVLLLLCGLASGCGRGTAGIEALEEQDPLMIRAQARKDARDIDGAIELYRQALTANPDLAKAHLNLGLLYEEHRRDYLRAIYHYRTYLEMRPDTEKRALIEELIRGAEMYYAASLPDRPAAAVEELAQAREKMDRLSAELNAVRAENANLQGLLRAARVTAMNEGAAPTAGGTPVSGTAVSVQAGTETYVVQEGDTLSRIARRVYDDSSAWRRIYEANRDTLRRPEDLRKGQVLRIPR